MLIKPEDFEENKKYPLIYYFYERRSDDLHGYEPPAPTRSRLNITFFASNGYLVFVPDIEYTIGYPGRSAEEYVDAGIDYLIETYRSEEHTSELQSRGHLVCRLLLEKKKWNEVQNRQPMDYEIG